MVTTHESRSLETLGLAVAGGVLGGVAGRVIGGSRPLIAITAGIAAVNGALAGRHRIHNLRHRRSLAAFALDSTWALSSTTAALVSHAIAFTRRDRGGRSDALSRHRDRHVYATGAVLRKGYALTLGNVVSGAGDVDGDSERSQRRRALVERHEDLHVWQARVLGPIYPITYVAWSIGGAMVGFMRWWRSREHPLVREVDAAAYYANPYEWWAYSRDGNWPPRTAITERVWRSPLVTPHDQL